MLYFLNFDKFEKIEVVHQFSLVCIFMWRVDWLFIVLEAQKKTIVSGFDVWLSLKISIKTLEMLLTVDKVPSVIV